MIVQDQVGNWVEDWSDSFYFILIWLNVQNELQIKEDSKVEEEYGERRPVD